MNIHEIEQMWQQLRLLRFPRGYGGKEVSGVCLVSVDTFAAGCIDTFMRCRGRLDADRIRSLQGCVEDIETAVPMLQGEAKVYYELLLNVSRKVLQSTV